MDLWIVRHAWAEPRDAAVWPDDDQRPLTDEGKRRFSRFIGKLAEGGFEPSLIVTSDLVRARQTADLIAQGLAGRTEIVQRPELRPGGRVEALLAWTAAQGERSGRVAWVGHAPEVGRFTAALVCQDGGWFRFAKGAVAMIRMAEPPQLGQGELRWLVTAKLLGC